MQIGIVLPSAPAYSETFFLNKIKGLEEHGFSVVIFANSINKNAPKDLNISVAPKLKGHIVKLGIRSIYTICLSFLFHYKNSKRLYNFDKNEGVNLLQRLKNIVSSHHILKSEVDWLHFGFGTMVFHKENVAKAIGAKMAVSFRGFDIGVYPLKKPNCYLKLWKKVNRIHVISDDIKDLVYKNGYEGESEIIKITPAIDVSFFNYEEEFNFSNENRFTTVARLHWKKGIEYTLNALSILKNKGVPFHYTIIGEGIDRERLEFAVHQLDLKNHVSFKGKVKHEQVKDELKKGDIYIQYSIQEGFCNAVLEAQALGLLCIVSDAEGLPENVNDGKTGWVVHRCNAKALADQIETVINLSYETKAMISKNARLRVLNNFGLDQQYKKFIEFYKPSKIRLTQAN